jgi:hypothetical protein
VSLFPRERMRDITSDRFALVKTSAIQPVEGCPPLARSRREAEGLKACSRSTRDLSEFIGACSRFIGVEKFRRGLLRLGNIASFTSDAEEVTLCPL